ncbi:hypothetical protein [Pseudosporangium ferrugineum]|uniref:Uncharacterized protein n=1 Tax=Pseudosporangium ferrugineum TaxID=439699 RepID=A0A2T0SAZ9_9ACTN|nr:hypothetical protein [Pseudosporangium ferrugineum]PRY30493.1 hypothetical protein CLV70_10445 [Pseudosporangium ferrugineum]
MRRKQALSLSVVAAVTTGLLAAAWPAFAGETPGLGPAVSAEPSFPEPPHKPIPSGPAEPPAPPSGEAPTPPPFPPGGDDPCDPADPDCDPGLPLPPGHPVSQPPVTGTPPTADPSVTPPPFPTFPPDDPEDH